MHREIGLALGHHLDSVPDDHVVVPVDMLDWPAVEAIADRLAALGHTVTLFDEHGPIMTIGQPE